MLYEERWFEVWPDIPDGWVYGGTNEYGTADRWFVPVEGPVYRRAAITHYGPAKDAVETQIELGWWVEIGDTDE